MTPPVDSKGAAIDEILGDFGVGRAICVLCKHDIYSHYWNRLGGDWDSCRVADCKCEGKEIQKEPNTVYECPFESEFIPSKEAKQAILAILAQEVKKAKIDELKGAITAITSPAKPIRENAYKYLSERLEAIERLG